MDVLRSRIVGRAVIPQSAIGDVRRVGEKFWSTRSERSLEGLRIIELDRPTRHSSGSSEPEARDDRRVSLDALPGIRRLLKDTFDLTGLRATYLVETAPFKGLHPHSHPPKQTEGIVRVHIPLIANSQSLFGEGHQAFRLHVGTAVVLERAQLHWEFNLGQDECIRLVCDFDPQVVPLSHLLKYPRSDALKPIERGDLPDRFIDFFRRAAMKIDARDVEQLLVVADMCFMQFAVRRYPSPWDLLIAYFAGRPDCIEALRQLGQRRVLH